MLAIVNLFHEEYQDGEKSLYISYVNRSQLLNERIIPNSNNANVIEGFKKLKNIIPDILELRDIIISALPKIYNSTGGKFGGLGGPSKPIFRKYRKKEVLEFTNLEHEYRVPNGVLYPLLASMRV